MPRVNHKPVLFLAGHRGLVGSAIARQLQAKGPAHNQPELLTASRSELDLLDQQAVNAFFQQHRIDQVIIAVAKIAGIKLCESYNRQYGRDYRSVMPTNLYGPGDNFHPEHSHVIPALLRRFHEATQTQAPEVVIWGSGTPRREFLHVDDMAAACLHVLSLDSETYQANTQPMCSHINVGTGVDVTIRELAETIARVTGYRGALRFDPSKPDGPPRKLLDVSRLQALGWRAGYGLEDGLRQTYGWFCDNLDAFRR